MTVRVDRTTLSRFVSQARARQTSAAQLMREALMRSAQQRNSARHRDGQ